jgi:3-methyladenine DNA glycosylase AlkD
MDTKEIISILKSKSHPENFEGMSRFGINTSKAFGIQIPVLRELAKKIGKNHRLSLELWKTGYHEAKILAVYLDEPSLVTEEQMETWVKDFDSWDVCDQCIGNLFDKTNFAYKKAVQWMKSVHEYTRRAGFVLMASLAVHDKKADDSEFIKFLPLIKKYSTDERNFVKKAVNWALRQIGKRNASLNKQAIVCANEILLIDNKAARWIANDALRELKSDAVRKKLGIRKF